MLLLKNLQQPYQNTKSGMFLISKLVNMSAPFLLSLTRTYSLFSPLTPMILHPAPAFSGEHRNAGVKVHFHICDPVNTPGEHVPLVNTAVSKTLCASLLSRNYQRQQFLLRSHCSVKHTCYCLERAIHVLKHAFIQLCLGLIT